MTAEPPPIPAKDLGIIPPKDLSILLKGLQPIRPPDNISATYHPPATGNLDVLQTALTANPEVVGLYRLLRSAQCFEVAESEEGRIYAESPFYLNPDNTKLGEFVRNDGSVDLEDLGALEKPYDFAGHNLTHQLVGRKDGSITALYRGTTQTGQPGWVEVLDTRLMDDELVREQFVSTRRDVDKVRVDEVDGRLIAVYTAEPTTINNAAVLQGIYENTNVDEGETETRQAIREITGASY